MDLMKIIEQTVQLLREQKLICLKSNNNEEITNIIKQTKEKNKLYK